MRMTRLACAILACLHNDLRGRLFFNIAGDVQVIRAWQEFERG